MREEWVSSYSALPCVTDDDDDCAVAILNGFDWFKSHLLQKMKATAEFRVPIKVQGYSWNSRCGL
jgi:hypothetical protein